MKSIVFGILIIVFAVTSCSRDDDSLQRIDQILNVYMKNGSNNQDLLNNKKTGSYTSYTVNDIFGDRDNSPVSIPLKMTTDSVFYMEYIAGAKRIKMDSVSPSNPGTGNSYHSQMQITFVKTINNATETTIDILEIQYRKSPTLFQVSKVLYNGKEEFSKDADAPNSINTVTIVK
ncbi:hypothetical protein [Chryseobacterium sp. M5A1_1a]